MPPDAGTDVICLMLPKDSLVSGSLEEDERFFIVATSSVCFSFAALCGRMSTKFPSAVLHKSGRAAVAFKKIVLVFVKIHMHC